MLPELSARETHVRTEDAALEIRSPLFLLLGLGLQVDVHQVRCQPEDVLVTKEASDSGLSISLIFHLHCHLMDVPLLQVKDQWVPAHAPATERTDKLVLPVDTGHFLL